VNAAKKTASDDKETVDLLKGFSPAPYSSPLSALPPQAGISSPNTASGKAERGIVGRDVEHRLAALDDFARMNPGQPVSGKAVELFPEITGRGESEMQPPPPLPVKAPEKWVKRKDKGETPPLFIGRVYSTWMGRGLARSDILRYDESLYRALYNWMKTNPLPDWFDLLTRKEVTDRKAEQYGIVVAGGSPQSEAESAERFRVVNSLKQRKSYRDKS